MLTLMLALFVDIFNEIQGTAILLEDIAPLHGRFCTVMRSGRALGRCSQHGLSQCLHLSKTNRSQSKPHVVITVVRSAHVLSRCTDRQVVVREHVVDG